MTDSKTAYQAIVENITPEAIAAFGVNAELEYDKNKKITAKGKGFQLDIDFLDDALELNLDLSFMLKPFQNKIMSSLEKKIGKYV